MAQRMNSADKITAKALLSRTELEALLEQFEPTEATRGSETLFEAGMAKVAKTIEHSLQRRGVFCDEVHVGKGRPSSGAGFRYEPAYRYLESLHIENALALQILATAFGAGKSDLPLDRPLTSLERELLGELCGEIVYSVEKELEKYLLKAGALKRISDYSVSVTLQNRKGVIAFAFKREPILPATPEAAAASLDSSDVEGTKVEAAVGAIAATVLRKGAEYAVHTFGKSSAVLLLDGTLPFMAKRLHSGDNRLAFAIEDAISEKSAFDGYYLCVAGSTIDDETLLGLEHGSVLSLEPYEVAVVYKDGKMAAKAKLLLQDGEIAVKIV